MHRLGQLFSFAFIHPDMHNFHIFIVLYICFLFLNVISCLKYYLHGLLYIFRQMEDFITWTDTSAIKKHVLDYNEMVRILTFVRLILEWFLSVLFIR